MIGYEVRVDEAKLRQAIGVFELVGGNTDKAVRVAINKAGPKVRTRASREIRSQVRLKAADVNRRLKFERATSGKLEGRIRAPSRGLLLSRFATNRQVADPNIRWLSPPPEPPRGIKVKVKPRGGTEKVTGGSDVAGKPFYMVLPNSRRLAIAARRRTSGPEGGEIKVFFGPSLSQVWTDVKDDVQPEASEIYTGELIDAMRFLLAKEHPL